MSILAPLFLSLFLPGQPTGEIIAFTNARIHTVEGPVIDIGTLVVRGEKLWLWVMPRCQPMQGWSIAQAK